MGLTTEEMFEALDALGLTWPEGMPVEELDRLLTAPIAKHTPGGKDHDQSKHGNRGTSSSDSWAARRPIPGQTSLFDEPSTPDPDPDPPSSSRVKVVFEGFYSDDPQDKASMDAARAAVDRFEKFLPGALPDTVTFKYMPRHLFTASGESLAFVDPSTLDKASEVNLAGAFGFDDLDEGIQETGTEADWNDIRQEDSGFAAVKGRTLPIQEMREAVLFHELAHVAVAIRGWGLNYDPSNWPSNFPAYNSQWYRAPVHVGHPTLPSTYASYSAPEYFAEALTDVEYNGSKAARLSHLTVDLFKMLLAGKLST